jgi:hypothetical protein
MPDLVGKLNRAYHALRKIVYADFSSDTGPGTPGMRLLPMTSLGSHFASDHATMPDGFYARLSAREVLGGEQASALA